MGQKTRVIFFGTSEFGVPVLRKLATGEYDPVAVYTQPDRPAGRGRKMRESPIAEAARDLGIPVEKPERIRRPDALAKLESLRPDVVALAAYGAIIPPKALAVPPHGWINIHPSLLPRHRGASPVVSAILAGDPVTGVSFFLMGEGLDNGPILKQIPTKVSNDETAGELEQRLADLSAEHIEAIVARWVSGEATPVPQNDDEATYAPKLSKEQGLLDWSLPAPELQRQVMAYNPWPGAYTFWRGQRLRVHRSIVLEDSPGGDPGTVFVNPPRKLPTVVCGNGSLELLELQLAGSKVVDGKAFLSGHQDFPGSSLAAPPPTD